MPEYTPAPAPSKAEFDSLASDVSTLNGNIENIEDTLSIATVYPTLDATKTTGGRVYCRVKAGWAYVQLFAVKFATSGDSQTGIVTGLPKAALQCGTLFTGDNAAKTAEISASGDSCWIEMDSTQLKAHIGAKYAYQHYTQLVYPIAES